MKVHITCDAHLLGVIPNPIPAIKAAPDYFRNIKPQSDHHPRNGTVKRCVPFLDALSAGFVIPLWCDVYVLARNGELQIDFPPNFPQPESLGTHDAAQIPKHPLATRPYGNAPMKWINPWVVETEPGVSCLFTAPLNHMETRFKLLDGIVDTDTYYNSVNLPFLWTGGDGEFIIAKGTPLVQVIPFRREFCDLQVAAVDDARRTKTRSILGTKLKNGYRDEIWHNKKAAIPEPEFEPKVDAAVELVAEPEATTPTVDADIDPAFSYEHTDEQAAPAILEVTPDA